MTTGKGSLFQLRLRNHIWVSQVSSHFSLSACAGVGTSPILRSFRNVPARDHPPSMRMPRTPSRPEANTPGPSHELPSFLVYFGFGLLPESIIYRPISP